MPRFWIAGPRMFGGLIRPGISFSTAELRGKKPPPVRRAIARELPAPAPALDEPSPFHARLPTPAGKRAPVCVHEIKIPAPEPKPPLWAHALAWIVVIGAYLVTFAGVALLVFVGGEFLILVATAPH